MVCYSNQIFTVIFVTNYTLSEHTFSWICTQNVRLQGVTLSSDLSLDRHVFTVSASGFH